MATTQNAFNDSSLSPPSVSSLVGVVRDENRNINSKNGDQNETQPTSVTFQNVENKSIKVIKKCAFHFC